MRRVSTNQPKRGMGPKGRDKIPAPLRGVPGKHVAQRTNTGFSDRKAYASQTPVRRNGGLLGGNLPFEADTRVRAGAEGNGLGSAPPGEGKRPGTPGSSKLIKANKSNHGARGTGRLSVSKLGGNDNFKGKTAAYDKLKNITHNEFEKLGAG